MNTRNARLHLLLPRITLGVALGSAAAVIGCDSKGDEKPVAKATAEGKPAVKAGGSEAKDPGLGKLAAKAVDEAGSSQAAPSIKASGVLGHFMLALPSTLLGKVAKQAVPPGAEMFVNENMIKMLVSAQVGSRGDVVNNFDFNHPLGCAVTDSTEVKVPVACVFGYLGGAKGLVGDLGSEGKQADSDDHAGLFKIQGEDLYVDALGSAVVISNSTAVFAGVKDYLQTHVVDRADKAPSDIEVVVHVAATMKRYEKELDPLLSQIGSSPIDSSDPLAGLLGGYSKTSGEHSVQYLKSVRQGMLGFGLDPLGLVVRFSVFPESGTQLEQQFKRSFKESIDVDFLGGLPESTWAMLSFHADRELTKSKQYVAMRDVLSQGYAKLLKLDHAVVAKALEDFIGEQSALYGADIGVGFVHLPGTSGAVILEAPIVGKDGRDSWKSWSEKFVAETILGPEVAAQVAWKFQSDAATVGGVSVDRWTISPTAAAVVELKKKSDYTSIAAKWPGMELVIDRVEVGGRVIFVAAPVGSEKYLKVAIDAANGKGGLGASKGFAALRGPSKRPISVHALNVKGMLTWLTEILPPSVVASMSMVTGKLGNDISDVFVVNYPGPKGSSASHFQISQPLIDQVKPLAGRL